MEIDMGKFEEQVKTYEARKGAYEEFGRVLQSILDRAVRNMSISAIVQARAKEVPSFAEKCIRKWDKYASPVDQFTDLCGARIILDSKRDLEPVGDYIRSNFEIDTANSEDASERLRVDEFGYLSVHHIVSLKDGADYDGVEIPPVVREVRDEEAARRFGLPPGLKLKAEVQVRTLLQHSWANLAHDNLYKSDFEPPAHLKRAAAKISAKLEDTDDSFARLLEDVQFYRSYYGAYMTPERIRKEIQILEAVRKYDSGNPKLAHKIARLAMANGDWRKAEEVLSAFAAGSPKLSPGMLRDLGSALCKQGDQKGRKLIEKAVKDDASDVDGLCELGDAQSPPNSREALRFYERAFELKPTYPRALRSFIQCKALLGDFSIVSMVRPHLEAAIKTCREWAGVRVHLPWAYYDIGFFSLLLGKPFESLAAFGKAVELSPTESPIDDMCRLMEEILEKLGDQSNGLARHVEWVRRFFLAAAVAKITQLAEASAADVERLEAVGRTAKDELEKLERQSDLEEKILADARKKAAKAEEALQEEIARRDLLRIKTAEAPCAYLANTDQGRIDTRFVVTARKSGEPPIFDKSEPVVIVAGGCDPTVERKVVEYRELIEYAFKGFRGTLVSGGTTAGISGIVAGLEFPAGAVRRISYLPPVTPYRAEAYTIYPTSGSGYSPLEPLQTWIDLLACGVRPGDVRIIGINGGDIAGFEYRLGLVMGAKVGILRDSGREASQIANDPDWKAGSGLVLLPKDKETLRLFVQPPFPSKVIHDADKEKLGRMAHEDHRKSRSKSLLPTDPALADWDDLLSTLKASSLQQIDHIEAKLERIGLKLRKVEGREIRLFRFKDKEQIEELAEVEHARWNVERFLAGWTLGERDHKKKTSPYLVSWDELPESAKEWDRRTVTELPRRLKELGYEIYRP